MGVFRAAMDLAMDSQMCIFENQVAKLVLVERNQSECAASFQI